MTLPKNIGEALVCDHVTDAEVNVIIILHCYSLNCKHIPETYHILHKWPQEYNILQHLQLFAISGSCYGGTDMQTSYCFSAWLGK